MNPIFTRVIAEAVARTTLEMLTRQCPKCRHEQVVREGRTEVNPGLQLKLQENDVLVLLGSPEQTDRTAEHLNAKEEAAT